MTPMRRFRSGHAGHADWRTALAQAAAMIDGTPSQPAPAAAPTLGLVYFTDYYAAHAETLLAALRQRWPGVSWAGSVGVGVAACGVEYFDQPALSLLLCSLPREHFEVFSGHGALAGGAAFSALVHADGGTPELPELLGQASARTRSGYLFGGLAASRGRTLHIADGVWQGGLSGVGFSADVALVSRVTQGCQPIGPARRISAAENNLLLQLDGQGALDCLLRDLGETLDSPRTLLPRLRSTLVGLSDETEALIERGAHFGRDTRVRHLIGVEPARGGVAVAERVAPGMRAAFCSRDVAAARRDLVRICSEIREDVESPAAEATLPAGPGAEPPAARRMLGAVYVSCAGRGGPHFGAPSAELKIVRQALGDVPLAGFFAGGEIARRHLYGYSGVLTVFTDPA